MQRSEQVDLASGITASYQTGVDEEEEDDYFDVDDEIEGSVGGDSCKEEEREADLKEERDEDVRKIRVEKGMKEEVIEITEEDDVSVAMDTSSKPSVVY